MGLAPHAHVYMPQMESSRYSKIRVLDIRELLSPVRIWRYPKLKAKPLVGPRVIWVLIPKMRFIPREGDTQLFKLAPGCMVDVEAVQAGKKGLLRLEVVLKCCCCCCCIVVLRPR